MEKRTIAAALLGVACAMPRFACGEIVSVDVSEWVAVGTGVTPSGWTVNGVDSYADGSARFNLNEEFAQSPIFSGVITQVTMRVRSSS